MGKRKKYGKWIGNENYGYSIGAVSMRPSQEYSIPSQMHLSIRDDPGFFIGMPSEIGYGSYIGIPQNTEGNIAAVGGNGSHKSTGVAMPTLRTWRGAICATDVKGELSEFYDQLYKNGLVTRPYVIFDPSNPEGP